MIALNPNSHSESDPLGMRVLVVDDDSDNRETTAHLIRLRGHETRTASGGQDALSQIPSFSPHLVLLDIAMPGMDGIDVATTVRQMPDMASPVIAALTGYGDAFHKMRCAEAGFDYYLVKPVASNDYDYLLWVTSQNARLRDAFLILQAEHKAAFYRFAVSQLDFGWLVLNCAAQQEKSLRQRSFEKVRRMQDRTTKWLKMSVGYPPEQKAALETLLAALQDRLAKMEEEAAAG